MRFDRGSEHGARVHPCRQPATPSTSGDAGTPTEEWVIACLLAVLGGARVAIALVRGEDFEVDVTIAGILGAIGLVMLARLAFARRP